MRGATNTVEYMLSKIDISIHAPREGSDPRLAVPTGHGPISIHAPREGSDPIEKIIGKKVEISIHAPREGSDAMAGNFPGDDEKFQSTLPVRGATADKDGPEPRQIISIHAPREGSDHLS